MCQRSTLEKNKKKSFEVNENENTMTENVWEGAQVVERGNRIAPNAQGENRKGNLK
jgi:hypothetical protein